MTRSKGKHMWRGGGIENRERTAGQVPRRRGGRREGGVLSTIGRRQPPRWWLSSEVRSGWGVQMPVRGWHPAVILTDEPQVSSGRVTGQVETALHLLQKVVGVETMEEAMPSASTGALPHWHPGPARASSNFLGSSAAGSSWPKCTEERGTW